MYCSIQHNTALIGTYRTMQNNILEYTIRTMCNYTVNSTTENASFKTEFPIIYLSGKAELKRKTHSITYTIGCVQI